MRQILTAGLLAGLLAFGLAACDDNLTATDGGSADAVTCTDGSDCATDCMVATDGTNGAPAAAISEAAGATADAAPACCPSQVKQECETVSDCLDMESCDSEMQCDSEKQCDMEQSCEEETPKVQD